MLWLRVLWVLAMGGSLLAALVLVAAAWQSEIPADFDPTLDASLAMALQLPDAPSLPIVSDPADEQPADLPASTPLVNPVTRPQVAVASTAGRPASDRPHLVAVIADGREVRGFTGAASVRAALGEAGVKLGPLDRVEPGLEQPIRGTTNIRVTRVREELATEETKLPYRTYSRFDPELDLDQVQVQRGEAGIIAREVRVTYEEGREVSRVVARELTDKAAVDEVTSYGTKVVFRELDTPSGPVRYWRHIRVYATYYYNSTCDKTPDDPTYGITFTGIETEKGVIAVDPSVIPLHTNLYVPGYGPGRAEDTGGLIKGKHIDLYYDEGQSDWRTGFTDVYLLAPVPAEFPPVLDGIGPVEKF